MSPRPSRTALVRGLEQLRRSNPALASRWCELAVCPAPFDLPAAAAIWAADDRVARGWLAALTGRRLVEDARSTDTYCLPAGLRTVALACPLRDEVRWRHAEYYLTLADAADALYYAGHEKMVEGLRLFDTAWPHLAAAYDWVRARQDRSAWRWLSDLAALTAYVHDVRIPPQRQIPLYETALAAARKLGDRERQAQHWGNLGVAHKNAGDPRKAIACYERQLVIVRALADRQGEANALGNLGTAYAELGEYARAIEHYEQALALGRELGDRRGEANALGSLGSVRRLTGEPRLALEYHEQALAISRALGDRRGEAASLGNLGNAYADLGQSTRAEELWSAAQGIFAELGDARGAR